MFLQGINTALITPFDGNRIDEEALRALVRRQIAAGVHGLIACGTTAETPALSEAEFDHVVKLVVDEVAGRVPVIAGTGTNNLDETLDFVVEACGPLQLVDFNRAKARFMQENDVDDLLRMK